METDSRQPTLAQRVFEVRVCFLAALLLRTCAPEWLHLFSLLSQVRSVRPLRGVFVSPFSLASSLFVPLLMAVLLVSLVLTSSHTPLTLLLLLQSALSSDKRCTALTAFKVASFHSDAMDSAKRTFATHRVCDCCAPKLPLAHVWHAAVLTALEAQGK